MAYRLVEPKMWADSRFRKVPHGAPREVWFYLLTGNQVTMLPGLQKVSALVIADETGLKTGDVTTALKVLEGLGLVQIDNEVRMMRLPNAPRYNPPSNGKVVKGWWSIWKALPDCVLRTEHVATLQACLPDAEWSGIAWGNTFGTLTGTDSEPIPNPVPNQSGTATGTDSPIPDQDPIPEPDPLPVASKEPDAPATVVTTLVDGKQGGLFTEEPAPAVSGKKPRKPPKSGAAVATGDVAEVWNHYLAKVSRTSIFNRERKERIEARLDDFKAHERGAVNVLKAAIDGFMLSPHHRGDGDSGWRADEEYMFRRMEHVEKGMGFYDRLRPKDPVVYVSAARIDFIPVPPEEAARLRIEERAKADAVLDEEARLKALQKAANAPPVVAPIRERTPEELAAHNAGRLDRMRALQVKFPDPKLAEKIRLAEEAEQVRP